MMKNKTLLTGKLAAVVLAAAMIFGVTACKGTAADTAEGTAAAESVTEAVPAALSTAAEETGTAVESREEAAEEATAEIGCRRPGYRNCRVQERHGDQGNGRGSEGRKKKRCRRGPGHN